MLNNVSMTSAEREKISTVFTQQSNESSVEKHSLRRCHSLIHADQEDIASVSGISKLLKVTEEPQALFSKHDLEIPPQAKIVSIPLSSFPPEMQQLMSAKAKDVPEVRKATEIPTVTYIWPVIKMEESSSRFWDYFQKSLIPTSPNSIRHCSTPDVIIEDLKCSQATPEKQFAQEELDRKRARTYTLIVKSYNSVVSGILKSLANIKNKDYTTLPLSSDSPFEEQLKNLLFTGNAIVIYSGQIYLLYVMSHYMLHQKTTAWLILCSAIHNAAYALLSRQYVVKQNIYCLTTHTTHTHQGKTSKATHFSLHKKTTTSQLKQCFPSTEKREQFLKNTAFPSKGSLQNRKKQAAHQKEDMELRKKFGIVKDVRVHLNRISLSELRQDSGKASARKLKFLSNTAFPSKGGLQKRKEKAARQEKRKEVRKKYGVVKDVRVRLNRTSLFELREDSGKASVRKWKVTTRIKKREKIPYLLSC